MKRNFIMCAILASAMLLIPLAAMQQENVPAGAQISDDNVTDGYISVMKTDDGTVEKLEDREYLIGVLAAEMSMLSHNEALKAQVIASYTYAIYLKQDKSSAEINRADISDDPSVHQGYISEDERKERWGDKFNEYEKKAGDIVDAVYGQAIYYEDKPIMAVYHNLNSGRTQSSLTVWKKELPYLTEVESPGDKLSAEYTRSMSFSPEEFERKIKQIDGITLDDKTEDLIGNIDKTDHGYIKSIEIYGNVISSVDFRTALELDSCCFEIISDKEKITVTTFGKGHLVGMSQYGADYMARQGADYREILQHYYRGTKIQ